MKTKSKGVKRKRDDTCEPLCRDDYISFWSERAPAFRRVLVDLGCGFQSDAGALLSLTPAASAA